MEKVILKTIKKYNLFESNSTIVAAVSGGADSMAMLHVLVKELPQYNLDVIVAHVNHKKRATSDLDEDLVKKTAEMYGLPFEVYHLPKNEKMENFHEYARTKRYEFFRQLAISYQGACIVTAHHGDDHLETVIHRLLYNQTVAGLIGIEPKTIQENVEVIRPLIELTKADIYEYCRVKNIKFREDESNQSQDYTRNRIRSNIVANLVTESPTIHAHVRTISQQISEDETYFKVQVDGLMQNVKKRDGILEVSRSLVHNLPNSLARRLIKRMLQDFSFKDITTHHIEEILKLISKNKPNLKLNLPHQITCLIAYDVVTFSKFTPEIKAYEFNLVLNSQVNLPMKSTIIVKYGRETEKTEKSCINKVDLCYNEIVLPLKVRTRIAGDRIALKNGYGTKKVKEIMIEAKIPKHLRDQWPIIIDANNEIIWIPLLKKSIYCQENLTKNKITIEYLQHGGNEENA